MKEDEVLSSLNATEKGLSEREAALRLQRFGENVLKEEKRKNPVLLFFSQFKDFMTLLLLAAAAISAVTSFITQDRSDLVDTVILLVIILLNNVIGFIQQYRADNAIARMKNAVTLRALVRREGREYSVAASRLVPGDILLLKEGDAVPADCRLLSAKNLKCNEAALTGESTDVEKSAEKIGGKTPLAERKNMLYASSYVVRGTACAVVTETGMDGEIGKIAGLLKDTEKSATPLERALEKLGKVISLCVIGIAAFLFVFGVFFRDEGILSNFMSSVAVAVAAIPEGLPAVVTILMAFGVQRMSRRRAIVRKLQAVETLGGCDCICSDKTGTLTENKMTVKNIALAAPEAEEKLLECMSFCNNAKRDGKQYVGDATETALLRYLDARGATIPEGERTDEIPFDSDRKMMSVRVRTGEGEYLFTKGGAEVVMKKCRFIADGSAGCRPLNAADKERFEKTAASMAQNALRVLGFAYRPYADGTGENDLVFLGVCGMIDPPKAGARESVSSCRAAGIDVKMITGDRKDTALAIARQIGIEATPSQVATGEELDGLKGEALEEKVVSSRIFARVNSSHKAYIVGALKKRGSTVAMTGDGVNDAPAVKSADIGIAMGTGTDVTKSVADIVVTDDDFSTIVSALKEGRHIFSNIRKTVSFFLATNLGEVLAVLFVTLFFFRFSFLNSTQLLWINLITDTFPVLALGAEKAESDIMQRPPLKAEKALFSARSLFSVLTLGIAQACLVVGIFALGLCLFNNAAALTMSFFAMSFSEILCAFVVRADRPFAGGKIFSNKILLLTASASFLLNLLLCAVPPLAAAFGIVPPDLAQWGLVAAFSLAVVPIGEGAKIFLRRAPSPFKGNVGRKRGKKDA